MHTGLATVVESFQLAHISTRDQISVYRGIATDDSGERIYGGQVMAQAISAVQQSVEEPFVLHSMQANFLRPGDLQVTVDYEVDALRNGRSFATRYVTAKQHNKAIFTATFSFQKPEQGLSHATTMPIAAAPETLRSEQERVEEYFAALGRTSSYGWPIDIRYVDPIDFANPKIKAAKDLVWVKSSGLLPNDYSVHQQLLAYASDNPILVSAFNPHALIPLMPNVMAATLSHALWIHQEFRMDDWLLFEVSSDITVGGRGMGRAKIFNRQGELVASAVQEGLIRLRK